MEETLLESLPFQVPALLEACNALIMSEISWKICLKMAKSLKLYLWRQLTDKTGQREENSEGLISLVKRAENLTA